MSCWAFGVAAALEGLNFIKNKKLASYSEQSLVDCSKSGNEGCNGGRAETAFQFTA